MLPKQTLNMISSDIYDIIIIQLMIVDLLFIVAAIAVLIFIYRVKFSKESLKKDIIQATYKAEEVLNKSEDKESDITLVNSNQNSSSWSNVDQEQQQQQEEEEEGPVDFKKQMRKEQKQKEKQQRKQAHEWFLKEEKEKREKADKDDFEKERAAEILRQKEEEVIAQLRQQEKKRKQAEFNKWKDMFKVQQSGKERLSEEQERNKAEAFNKQFMSLLRKKKMVLLQDLSHKYKMSTKELIDKIKQLEARKLISGIFDERGKYLVIQDCQWSAIKSYISVRGRVKKTDIMTQCARLIKIPDQVEEDLLNLIGKDEEKSQ